MGVCSSLSHTHSFDLGKGCHFTSPCVCCCCVCVRTSPLPIRSPVSSSSSSCCDGGGDGGGEPLPFDSASFAQHAAWSAFVADYNNTLSSTPSVTSHFLSASSSSSSSSSQSSSSSRSRLPPFFRVLDKYKKTAETAGRVAAKYRPALSHVDDTVCSSTSTSTSTSTSVGSGDKGVKEKQQSGVMEVSISPPKFEMMEEEGLLTLGGIDDVFAVCLIAVGFLICPCPFRRARMRLDMHPLASSSSSSCCTTRSSSHRPLRQFGRSSGFAAYQLLPGAASYNIASAAPATYVVRAQTNLNVEPIPTPVLPSSPSVEHLIFKLNPYASVPVFFGPFSDARPRDLCCSEDRPIIYGRRFRPLDIVYVRTAAYGFLEIGENMWIYTHSSQRNQDYIKTRLHWQRVQTPPSTMDMLVRMEATQTTVSPAPTREFMQGDNRVIINYAPDLPK